MPPESHPAGTPRRALSPREQEVLHSVVSHYIQTGTPVSSRVVARVNSEHLSPASLRAIMADLEEAGYITHPHTSAGRVPTDLGYRVYVDSLDVRRGLTSEERTGLRENLYAPGGMDSLVSRCCKLLAVASNQIGVGTEPVRAANAYRHVEFLRIGPHRVLVMFISSSGLVRQHVVATAEDLPPAELERLANYLNQELQGRSLEDVRGRILSLMQDERTQYDRLARRALEIGSQFFSTDGIDVRELHVDGAGNLLERPDPADFDRMKTLLAALEDKRRIVRLLDSCVANKGVVTAIGSENRDPELEGLSVVASSYSMGACQVGMLGIIGPTRMDYDRAMALVEHVAQLLGTALEDGRS